MNTLFKKKNQARDADGEMSQEKKGLQLLIKIIP